MSGCEYCSGIEEFADSNEDNYVSGNPSVCILGNILSIKYDAYSCDSSFDREYRINYCPMCGEKLEGK